MSAFGHADPQVLAIIDAGDAPTEQLAKLIAPCSVFSENKIPAQARPGPTTAPPRRKLQAGAGRRNKPESRRLLRRLGKPPHPERQAADKAKRDALRAAGWNVLTFWGGHIVRDAEGCARQIIDALNTA